MDPEGIHALITHLLGPVCHTCILARASKNLMSCCTNHHRGADIDACVDGRGRENGAGWATACVILYF